MTREDDFIGQLEGYLDEYEGLTPLPDTTRDAIRARLPTTRQIGTLPAPMRYLSMSMSIPAPARYGLVAAAVGAAVALGAPFLGLGSNRGTGDSATPTPTSTSAPTSTPDPTPELIEPGAIEPAADLDNSYRLLQAGTYHVDLPMRITFTVPAGWSEWAYTSEATQLNLMGPISGELSFEIVENVSADPCTDELLDPPVGPSVDDLVTALSALEGFDVSPVTNVKIDGYRGKQLTLTSPTSGCDMQTWATSTRQNGVGLGEVNHVRILDVDGVRLLIGLAPPDDATTQRQVEAILDSIRITP
jgi:hypothetical protein